MSWCYWDIHYFDPLRGMGSDRSSDATTSQLHNVQPDHMCCCELQFCLSLSVQNMRASRAIVCRPSLITNAGTREASFWFLMSSGFLLLELTVRLSESVCREMGYFQSFTFWLYKRNSLLSFDRIVFDLLLLSSNQQSHSLCKVNAAVILFWSSLAKHHNCGNLASASIAWSWTLTNPYETVAIVISCCLQ